MRMKGRYIAIWIIMNFFRRGVSIAILQLRMKSFPPWGINIILVPSHIPRHTNGRPLFLCWMRRCMTPSWLDTILFCGFNNGSLLERLHPSSSAISIPGAKPAMKTNMPPNAPSVVNRSWTRFSMPWERRGTPRDVLSARYRPYPPLNRPPLVENGLC
jgi:hypothetical protein